MALTAVCAAVSGRSAALPAPDRFTGLRRRRSPPAGCAVCPHRGVHWAGMPARSSKGTAPQGAAV